MPHGRFKGKREASPGGFASTFLEVRPMFMSVEERKERVEGLVRKAWLTLKPLADEDPTFKEALDKSIALYTQALEIQPESLSALIGRSTTRYQAGYFEEAKDDAKRALALQPEDCDYLLLAGVFEGEELREFLTQVIPRMSKNSPFRVHLLEQLQAL